MSPGIHVILFGLCVRIFWRRRRLLQILMLAAVTVMFFFATADIAVSWNIAIRHTTKLYRSDTLTFYKAIYPKFIIHLFNKLVSSVLYSSPREGLTQNSLIADILLVRFRISFRVLGSLNLLKVNESQILRCYVVWGKSKVILYLGGSLLLVGTGKGTPIRMQTSSLKF